MIAERLHPKALERFDEAFECWNRGELDLMVEPYAEDAIFDVSAVFTDVAPKRGWDEIRAYWQSLREVWDGLRIDPIEGWDLGDGHFVIDQRVWGRGTNSGIDIDQRFSMLYTLRSEDGKVAHARLLPDLETAISVAKRPLEETLD